MKDYLGVWRTDVRNIFFDLNNVFISVSSVKRNFISSFVRKLIFPISRKYFCGTLCTCTYCQFVFQTLQFYHRYCHRLFVFLPSLLCIGLSEFAGYTAAFLLYKLSFWIIFSAFCGWCLAWVRNIYRFLGALSLVWGFYLHHT